jgi:hypothetical protein
MKERWIKHQELVVPAKPPNSESHVGLVGRNATCVPLTTHTSNYLHTPFTVTTDTLAHGMKPGLCAASDHLHCGATLQPQNQQLHRESRAADSFSIPGSTHMTMHAAPPAVAITLKSSECVLSCYTTSHTSSSPYSPCLHHAFYRQQPLATRSANTMNPMKATKYMELQKTAQHMAKTTNIGRPLGNSHRARTPPTSQSIGNGLPQQIRS